TRNRRNTVGDVEYRLFAPARGHDHLLERVAVTDRLGKAQWRKQRAAGAGEQRDANCVAQRGPRACGNAASRFHHVEFSHGLLSDSIGPRQRRRIKRYARERRKKSTHALVMPERTLCVPIGRPPTSSAPRRDSWLPPRLESDCAADY